MICVVLTLGDARLLLGVTAALGSATALIALHPTVLRRFITGPLERTPRLGRSCFAERLVQFGSWFESNDPDGLSDGRSRSIHPGPVEEDGELDPGSRFSPRTALIITALVAVLVAVAQFIWLSRYRTIGTLDWDEARYVAGAIRYRQILLGGYGEDVSLFYGPALPMWSALFMVFAPLTTLTAFVSQLPITIGIAVATTAVALRITKPTAAAVAGVAVALLPMTIAVTQTYLLVLGAAFGLTAATWALLSSDHGNNRRIWLTIPFLALAPLSRGMTAGLLPATAVAFLLYTAASARGFRRCLLALSLTAIALSLYLLTKGSAIVSYVVTGLSLDDVQSVGLFERVDVRWSEVTDGFGHPVLQTATVLALLGAALWLKRNRFRFSVRSNPVLVVAIIVVVGAAVLLAGGYFGDLGFWAYPLVPLLMVLLVALTMQLPRPARVTGASAMLVYLGYLALVALWVLPYDSPIAATAMGRYRQPVYESYMSGHDPRYTRERRSDQALASQEWDDAVTAIDEHLCRLDEMTLQDLEVLYLGGTAFKIYNPEVLAARQQRDSPDFDIGYLAESEGDYAKALVASTPGSHRVLLIPEIDTGPAADGRTTEDIERVLEDHLYLTGQHLRSYAESEGWEIVDRIPLPLGDELLVYAEPGVF